MEILVQKLDTLHSAYEYLQRLYSGLNTAVGYFRVGEITKGYELIQGAVAGLEWLTEVVTLTQDILVEAVDINSFKETIGEIIDAIENEDSILIADILEYELMEQLEKWNDIIVASYNNYVE